MNQAKAMKYLLLMMFSVLLWSCDKEDDPFSGGDNYIVSFSLTKGDKTINATILEDEIVVIVPMDYSLSGAVPKVGLSENTTIMPDPASVTDWGSEHVFVVTAHNGVKRSYQYKVAGTEDYAKGSVVLATQADVDAFGTSGVTVIEGSLIIGATSGRDSIKTIEPLNAVKKIGYALIIKSTYGNKTLDGLTALETIGGALRIETSGLQEAKFASLKSVMDIDIVSKSIVKFECPKLTHAYGNLRMAIINLTVVNMPLLESIGRDFELNVPDFRNDVSYLQSLVLPALKNVTGTFYVHNQTNINKIDLPEFTTCGSINLNNCSTLGTLTLLLPKLEKCENDLIYENLKKLQEVKLPSLTKAGSIMINCGDLESVDIPKLKEVSKDLYICPFLDMDVDGFKNLKALTTVGGLYHIKYGYDTPMKNLILPPVLKNCKTLKLEDCATLEKVDITGMDIQELIIERGSLINLTIKGSRVFNGKLNVNGEGNSTIATGSYSYAFPKFEGIEEISGLFITPGTLSDLAIAGIKKINGDFRIVNYPLNSLSVQNLTEVTGNLTLGHHDLTDVVVASIQKVGGNISMGENSIYQSFYGKTISFPALTEAGGVYIYAGDNTQDVQIPLLATVKNSLTLMAPYDSRWPGNNTKLTNLNGFSGLRSVGSVNIERMNALGSYEGLKNCLGTLTDSKWKVSGNKYNPTLQDMKDGNWNQ